jgi:3-dehydroquinate synthase
MKDNISQIDIEGLKAALAKFEPSKTYYIVDSTVFDNYAGELGLDSVTNVFRLNSPEADKNLERYNECINTFIDMDIRRDCHVVAIGGGATSDFAGFVAASVLRGLKWSVVPTSLLSMVDACIGGKVGLNVEQGKNLIGAFHEPEMIYLCTHFLQSLPKPEYESGLGEIIKYAFLSTEINKLVKKEAPIEEVIFNCLKYKKKITDGDLREEGDRKILNFGHTLGHAFEKELSLPHGTAVTLGIYHTIKSFHHDLLSELYSLMDILKLDRNLLYTRPKNEESFWQFVRRDKKIVGDEVHFVTLKSLGHAQVSPMVIDNLVEQIVF